MALVGVGQWDLDSIKQTVLNGLAIPDVAEILVAIQTGPVLAERARAIILTEWEDPLDQMVNDDLDLLTNTLVADEDFISKVEQNLSGVGWSLEANWLPDEDIWKLLFVLSVEVG